MRFSFLAATLAALAIALAIPIAGCGSGDADSTTEAEQGTGLPSAEDLPDGTVATVVHVPPGAAAPLEASYEDCEGEEVTPDVGEITKLEYACAFVQAAVAAELTETPHPGDRNFDETREAAMKSLIEAAWLQALAVEEGISVSRPEIVKELAHLQEENFPKKSEYEKFLEKSHYSRHDAEERVKLQIISDRLQQRVEQGAPGKLAAEEALTKLVAGFHRKWRARTVCARGFTTILCSNVEAPAPE